MASKNLDRRRNRTLGRSKKIPDISADYGLDGGRLQAEGSGMTKLE